MEITIERLKYHLNESFNEITEVSNYISRDLKINEFLQKEYKDNVDYYSDYISLVQENIINNFYVSQALESIEIYTTNPTIINGGVFGICERSSIRIGIEFTKRIIRTWFYIHIMKRINNSHQS
ncbi:hypothetical protein AAHH67_05925 [Niallia circulans]